MDPIVVGSLKGSPGATQAAAYLAAAWPEPERVLVEIDPAGGTLAADWGLRVRPGLVETAGFVDEPESDPASALAAGTQRVPIAGVDVDAVCAPIDPGQAHSLVARLAAPGARLLQPPELRVIADAGRLGPDTAAWPLLGRSDAVIVVIEGRLEQVGHLRGAVDVLWSVCGPHLAVLVRPADYDARAVADFLYVAEIDVPVLGDLPPLPTRLRRRTAMREWRKVAAAVLAHADRQALAAIEDTEPGTWTS